MAIHFHEGLPGAGKSYEACVFHILPALKSGRQVITNIRGVNWAKFAELLGEPEEYVRMLLLYIEPAEQDGDASDLERVKNEFADKTPDNAMIVWDEVQDYYPSGNYKLPHNQQKFWTEHRHRGLEIVIMGQDRDDVHKIIRSRIEDVIYFLKLQAIGRPSQYKWEQWQKQGKGKFVKIGSGVRSYEAQYFGLYMSHRREGVKGGVYQTQRSNLLKNTRALTLGVPAAFLVAAYAVWHLVGFFQPSSVVPVGAVTVTETKAPPPAALVNPPPPSLAPPVSAQAQQLPAKPVQRESIDYFDKLAQEHSVRASAIIDSAKPGKELMGTIEILDSSFHLKEVFTVDEVRALGWIVSRKGYGLLLEKEGIAYVARTWPLDLYGRVDNRTANSLDATQAKPGSGQGVGPPSSLHVAGMSPATDARGVRASQ